MVKGHRLPALWGVTGGALLSVFTIVRVVLHMAGYTFLRGSPVIAAGMTGGALDLGVLPLQREEAVVEILQRARWEYNSHPILQFAGLAGFLERSLWRDSRNHLF